MHNSLKKNHGGIKVLRINLVRLKQYGKVKGLSSTWLHRDLLKAQNLWGLWFRKNQKPH